MKQMKEIWNKYYDYLIIALIYGLLHVFMHTDYWDDAKMSTVLASYNYNLIAYLNNVWHNWGSTIFLLGTESVIEALPDYIWKVLDVLMIEIIYHNLSRTVRRLTADSPTSAFPVRIWLLLFFFCIPYSLFASAGWMTTTIAYVWTFAAFFYILNVFLAASQGGEIKLHTYVIFGLAVIYCSNCNLVSAAVFVIFLYLFIICGSKTTSLRILFAQAMFGSILNIIMFIISPGNLSRNMRDAEFHDTGDMLNLSFMGHIRMGVNSAFYHFTSVPNIILFTFCLLLIVCTFYQTKKLLVRAISCLPLALDLFWSGYLFFAYTIPNRTLTYTYPDAAFQVCPEGEQILAMICALIMVLSICYLLAYLTGFSTLSWFMIGCLLVLGLLPNVALGFTTTVSASVMRTAMFFYFSLVLCACILMTVHGILRRRWWRIAFYVLGGLGMLLNILQVIRHIMVYG